MFDERADAAIRLIGYGVLVLLVANDLPSSL